MIFYRISRAWQKIKADRIKKSLKDLKTDTHFKIENPDQISPLEELPQEVIANVCTFLDIKSALNLEGSSKQLYHKIRIVKPPQENQKQNAVSNRKRFQNWYYGEKGQTSNRYMLPMLVGGYAGAVIGGLAAVVGAVVLGSMLLGPGGMAVGGVLGVPLGIVGIGAGLLVGAALGAIVSGVFGVVGYLLASLSDAVDYLGSKIILGSHAALNAVRPNKKSPDRNLAITLEVVPIKSANETTAPLSPTHPSPLRYALRKVVPQTKTQQHLDHTNNSVSYSK